MRIVFFGTPDLAVPSLRETAAHHDVTAVVCQPDRPKGRSRKPVPPPVKEWAVAHDIPVHQPAKLNDGAFEAWLTSHHPDACALAAYGRILKQPILDVPKLGFLNMHPSLLPKYRGPSPIQSALLQGETETGITIIRLSMDMDAGDIVSQSREPISNDDNGITLSERLANRGATMLAEALDNLASGKATFRSQDHSAATYCSILTKEDGRIDWTCTAIDIHNQVRGSQPWPGAYTTLDGETIRVFKTARSESPANGEPGRVLGTENREILVATGEGCIAITNLQAPGKKAMDADAFLRGRPLPPTTQFGT